MRIIRLRRDLGLNLVGAAMVLDLTEETHRLRSEAMPIGLLQLDALRQSEEVSLANVSYKF